MGVELEHLRRRVAAEGRVVRVVIAEVRGSAPREAGAAMIVGPAGPTGTIGGG
ncbi:MAG: XdhC family protein, partial [Pseudooceanicola nanhaiensis]